jgi:FkbM family methyltransferase
MIVWRAGIGVWWPAYDPKWEAGYAYTMKRVADMDVSAARCSRRDVCVQAGGHVGMWPRRLAGIFAAVHSFECEPALFRCLERNTENVENLTIAECALGDAVGESRMRLHSSAGRSHITPEGNIKVRQITIDSMALPKCDALFLDVEGYECAVLRGATRTIAEHRPVIHVELLPQHAVTLRAALAALKYREVARVHGDGVFVHAG